MPYANQPDCLSIDRHPMQTMLLAALRSRPQACHGIFGGSEPGHITHAASSDDAEAVVILEHSHPEGLGIFYSSLHDRQPDAGLIRHIAAELRLTNPARCILLALDTEGRMEALAYRISGETFTSLPLEMTEDHALSATGASR